MRRASATASGPAATPQRPMPTSISTSTGNRTPACAAAARSLRPAPDRRRRRRRARAAPAPPGARVLRRRPPVADQDVGNAAPGERLGLGDFLRALPDRTAGDLEVGDDWRICASWRARAASPRCLPASRPCGRDWPRTRRGRAPGPGCRSPPRASRVRRAPLASSMVSFAGVTIARPASTCNDEGSTGEPWFARPVLARTKGNPKRDTIRPSAGSGARACDVARARLRRDRDRRPLST